MAEPTIQGGAEAITAGIHCRAVPTPFAIGPVNVYVIEGSPLTLVDTGPNIATVMAELQRLIVATGHRPADLELLLVTHPHSDHIGLTEIVARASGAEVACLDSAADTLERYEEHRAADDDYSASLMLRHGIDPRVVTALRSVARISGFYGASAHVTRRLADGEEIRIGDRSLRALHRPGHSPSDTVFHDERGRVLFAGDHLLARTSSNALITRPASDDWDGARPRPLVDYRRSLRATAALDVDVVLAGHGPAITDHVALIEHRLRRHEERAEQILELLRQGPRSAHELATEMWGDVAITQAFLTLSEVLGHIDLLVDDGAVVEDETGTTVVFAAT
jgi:glyoxylase-like metal-dependent hydrolase (beta-lactamase superfamily II)